MRICPRTFKEPLRFATGGDWVTIFQRHVRRTFEVGPGGGINIIKGNIEGTHGGDEYPRGNS
jgi:hypothetical protein